MILEITEKEANTLLQLIDLAVKAGGLNIAGVSHEIAMKIKSELDKEAQLASE